MLHKNNKKTNKTQNLEIDVKEKELEYEAIKEAIEKGNIDILSNFQLKNIKSTKNSTKIPKKLPEKEKEKRDEIRRLKEAEDLAQIQQKLFRQIKGRKKIEPLLKKPLYSNADVFGANIEKECEKIFPKEEKNKKIELLRSENVVIKNNKNISKNTNNINNSNIEKSNIVDRKNINKKYKINFEKSNEIDEVKDKEYLDKLDYEIKKFYLDKCEKIFRFLKDIHLCRYIDEFLKQGYDIYEEFLEIPDDFFQQMSVPFLNISQQQKFYNKLNLIKNKYKQKYSINYKINKKEIKNDFIDSKINITNDSNINNNINNNNTNKHSDKALNDLGDKNKSKYSENNLNDLNNNNNNISKNNSLLEKQNEKINAKNIIKDTSSKIEKEELMYKTSYDIDELEKQRSEEFKKAVEQWRNNKSSRPNTSYIPQDNKITSDVGMTIKTAYIPRKNNLYCWNCYKKFLKEDGITKEYSNNYELNSKYNTKNFCSLKCIKDYEKKQRSQYMCFQCRKMCNLMQGFIAFEGEKFCSAACKNKYIQEEKESLKRKKEDKKNKKENEDKNNININNGNNDNNKKDELNNENNEEEENSYDPMEDF